MSGRRKVQDPACRSEATSFINVFMAPTKCQRYTTNPELLKENISHDLDRHLDPRCAIAVGNKVHTSSDLIDVLTTALDGLDSGYCLVPGPYCPLPWRVHREIPRADLVDNQVWWLSNVLMSFGGGAAGFYAAEESTTPTRVLLLSTVAQTARAARALDRLSN